MNDHMTAMAGFHRPIRRMAAVTLAVLIAALLPACSSSSGDGTDDASGKTSAFVDVQTIEQEYQDTLATLDFPDGYTPPERMEDLQASSYEKGFGENSASWIWVCAWERDWLDHYASDTDEAAKALEELGKAEDMPFLGADRTDDNTRTAFQSNLDKAALNDPSGIQNDVDLNCAAQ